MDVSPILYKHWNITLKTSTNTCLSFLAWTDVTYKLHSNVIVTVRNLHVLRNPFTVVKRPELGCLGEILARQGALFTFFVPIYRTLNYTQPNFRFINQFYRYWLTKGLWISQVVEVHTLARKYKPDWCRMSIAEAFSSQDKAVLFYQEWIKHVHSSIPAHRLLTWDSVSILPILT